MLIPMFLLIMTLFSPPQLNSEEGAGFNHEHTYVTCDLKGQLGNQLFQIATTLAYAWDYGAIPVFPDLNKNDPNLPNWKLTYNRDHLFFRLNTSDSPRPFTTSYQEISWHSSEQLPFQKDQKLIGYFQSWIRFDRYRDRILEVFAPSESDYNYLREKYADLMQNPNTVSIHVRTFNADLHNSKWHPFMGMEYFRKATSLFPPDTLFVVFSDRINWCKMHFPELNKSFVFIEGNDDIQDLLLMSMMKNQIICNSSFSWWAAYLNQNPNKIVIAPTSFMHPDLYAFPLVQPNELFLPDWHMVAPNFSEPYPSDMTHYDRTKSVDGD